jgi:hypothetical protein
MRQALLVTSLAMLIMAGCGGTWIDDERNFKRVFNFDKPPDVSIVHSYYWKSSHWSNEYRYFIALRAPVRFVEGLTDATLMTARIPDEEMVASCGDKPQWFLPDSLANYQGWIPKTTNRYRVSRNKADGTLFVCDQRL